MSQIHTRLAQVQNRILQAALAAQRYPHDILLVAVSKHRPVADILTAYQAGIRHFGENRSDELAEKATELAHLEDIRWHFIGHLQSRQTDLVAQHAHYFHALDRLKIATRLSKQLQKNNKSLPVFLQVNVSGEASKQGFACEDWQNKPAQIDTLKQTIQQIQALPNLPIQGLMTMAPRQQSPDQLQTLFQRTQRLSAQLPIHDGLSMGMSNDFEIAIGAGATHIRVGSQIFADG